MLGIIIAMAASASPQSATPPAPNQATTGEQRETERPATAASTRKPDKHKPEQKNGEPPANPAEDRKPDGVLMPGAPGTDDPLIPDGGPKGR